jgi:four helix bundle protein
MIDLKDRTFNYAVNIRKLVKSLNQNRLNHDDFVQLIRSSGSVGANFIEAIESLSKKDFIYRIRICLKEAKESRYWLKVIENTNMISSPDEILALIQESKELIRIFSSIIQKNLKKQ